MVCVRLARIALAGLAAMLAAAAAQACEPPAGATGARLASIDERGDILLTDGRLVRLVGIAWPPAHQPGARARLARAVALLVQDAELVAGADARTDRWGRQAVQLFAGPEWVQGRLVEDGHVLAWPEAAGRGCWPQLLERDMLARDGGLGVWSALGRRPLGDARNMSEGGFARRLVFEGVVRSVRPGRSVTFVNFTGPRGVTPSWFVSKRLSADFSRSGRDVATFQGKRLRLRAEYSANPTPRLRVATPDGVEVLD